MAKPRVSAGGGLPAVAYVLRKSRAAGGMFRMYRRMRKRNTCKTCALGMGGQRGGMVNEAGHFPEVCKKSIQAQASDMQGPITESIIGQYPFSRLERMTSAELDGMGRISFPMLANPAGAGFRRIGWDEAFERMSAAFAAAAPNGTFFYSSGRASNEAAFLMQLIARAYGTANIHNCSSYCHNASSVALNRVYGTGTASIVLEDLQQADLLIVAGANPASNHPRLITQLVELRRRGGKVIVVNPLRELGLTRFRVPSDVRSMLFGSQICDLYLQPHVGSDVALFKALLKGVVEVGGVDQSYVDQHTEGWEFVAADLADTSWDDLVVASGVARAEIDEAVQMLVSAKRGIFCWAMGLTHHANGVDNVVALANLALSRGWLGRPGCGLLPIRGHSNVQGVGSVGVAPELKEAFAHKMRDIYKIESGETPGWDTYQSMEAAARGDVVAAFMLGGNLFASNPDRAWARDALRRIPFSVYVSTTMNEGHVHGRGETTLVLPALSRDEETQATTQESMFSYVRMSDGGVQPPSTEMRSEVEILASFAERILPANRFDWSTLRSHAALRQQIARVVPGYRGIGELDDTRSEFRIGGRVFHEPSFQTKSGRAGFHVIEASAFAAADNEFRLMTLRSEGQFNTVVYETEDLYRGNTRRDVVMMSQQDALRLNVVEGDTVRVETETGSLEVVVAVVDIRAGNLAMYYPEANALVPRRIDPASGTPAFKSIVARVGVANRTTG